MPRVDCGALDDSGYRRNINRNYGYNGDSQLYQDKEIHGREKDVRPMQAGRIVWEGVKVGLWFDRDVTREASLYYPRALDVNRKVLEG